MPVSPSLINKIKKLLALGQSANPNEANNAKVMAAKLIAKHRISEQDLSCQDNKPLYGDNEKLYSSVGIINWKQHLAFAIATHFNCQIVQEEFINDELHYAYYVYGKHVIKVQHIFHTLINKIKILQDVACLNKNDTYIECYCEGIVASIKLNISMMGNFSPPSQTTSIISKSLDTINKDGAEKKIDIGDGVVIKDMLAYIKGLEDGKSIHLDFS